LRHFALCCLFGRLHYLPVYRAVRTASEQLLLSAAADRAAAQLSLGIPKGTRIFVDTRYFQGYDDGYAIAAIRTQMLKNGLMLVDDRLQAEAVVQVSSGALSTDQKSLLIGYRN